jgi:hypothetical protein
MRNDTNLTADARDQQHAVDRFADPDELQHPREAWPVRAAYQALPVARVGEHRQDMGQPRQHQSGACGTH